MSFMFFSVACSATQALTAGECFGGAARRANYINNVRAARENVLLLDCGGSFFGSLFWQVLNVEPTVFYMNALKYDFSAINTIDFHGSETALAAYIDGLDASIPVILTNMNISGDPLLARNRPNNQPRTVPWAVKVVGKRKIGFIALVAYTIKTKTLWAKNTVVDSDSNTMTYRALSALRRAHPDCSIIIAVGEHNEENQVDACTRTRSQKTFLSEFAEHVDVVLFRDSHTTTVITNIFGEKVVSLEMPEKNGAGMGHAEFLFDEVGNLQTYSAVADKIDSLDIDQTIW